MRLLDKSIWRRIYETRLTNYYYWLKVLLSALGIFLTINLSVWITLVFIAFTWGFIGYGEKKDEFTV
jgi:hypothetical protein